MDDLVTGIGLGIIIYAALAFYAMHYWEGDMWGDFKKLSKFILFFIVVAPIVAVISILAGPFYDMCIMAGEKKALDPMMDRVGDWLAKACKKFAENNQQQPSS